jgi:hypothetical protein
LKNALDGLEHDLKRRVRLISQYELYGSWDILIRFALARCETTNEDIAHRIAFRVANALDISSAEIQGALSPESSSNGNQLTDSVRTRRMQLIRIESVEYASPDGCRAHFVWDGHAYARKDMQRSFVIITKSNEHEIEIGEWRSATHCIQNGIERIQADCMNGSFWTLHYGYKSIVIEGLFRSSSFGDLRIMTMQLASCFEAPKWTRKTHIGYAHREWIFGRFETYISDAEKEIRKHEFVAQGLITDSRAGLEDAQLFRWLCCAARHCQLFTDILRSALKLPFGTSARIRQVLQVNLDDETGNGEPEKAHYQEYVLLAATLGRLSEFESYRVGSGLTKALAVANRLILDDVVSPGLIFGYVLINEALISTIFQAVKRAFNAHHPDIDMQFFDKHISTDKGHVQQLVAAGDQLPERYDGDVVEGILRGKNAMIWLLDEACGSWQASR